MKTHRKPLAAVPFLILDDPTTLPLAVGVIVLVVAAAMVAGFTRVQVHRLNDQLFAPDDGEQSDSAAIVTVILLVVAVLVAAKLMGLQL